MTITWTDDMIAAITQARANGLSWREAGAAAGVSKQVARTFITSADDAIKERTIRLPAAPVDYPSVPFVADDPPMEREVADLRHNDSYALPAGHPISWGAITDGLHMAGAQFA